jgi:hypothetical protein
MEIIKEYKTEHYNNNLEVVDNIIGNYNDIDSLIKSLNDKTLLIWLRACNIMVKNNKKYFSETTTMLTLSIRMFLRELDVDEGIVLNNKQIQTIFERFHLIIKKEFVSRYKKKKNDTTYTLLKD